MTLRSGGDLVTSHVGEYSLRTNSDRPSYLAHRKSVLPIQAPDLILSKTCESSPAGQSVALHGRSLPDPVSPHVFTKGGRIHSKPTGDSSLTQAFVPVETLHLFPTDLRDDAVIGGWSTANQVIHDPRQRIALDPTSPMELRSNSSQIIDPADIKDKAVAPGLSTRTLQCDTTSAHEISDRLQRLPIRVAEVDEPLTASVRLAIDTSRTLAIEESGHVIPCDNHVHILPSDGDR